MGENRDQVMGRIKQSIGALTGDRALRRQGRRDELVGRTKHHADHAIELTRSKLEGVLPSRSSDDKKD